MRTITNGTAKLRILSVIFGIVFVILSCSACAPKQAESKPAEESASGEVVQISFSMESDCGACHTSAMKSKDDPTTLASIHARENSIACVTCHNGEVELTEAHAGIDGQTPEPTRLKKAKIADETCFSCHESYPALAEKTAGSTTLTDVNGRSMNPHETKQLNEEHDEDITCLKCHGEHKEKDTADVQAYCFNCHHMKVYECNTCHETHS